MTDLRELLMEARNALEWAPGDTLDLVRRIDNALIAEALDLESSVYTDKDAVYTERNRVVAALARLFPSGLARTDIPGWDPEWNECVYIDLPTGQVSWHYHYRDAYLFAGLPLYEKPWDGHTTEEKYRRLAAMGSRRMDATKEQNNAALRARAETAEQALSKARAEADRLRSDADRLAAALRAFACGHPSGTADAAIARYEAGVEVDHEV